MANPLVVDLPKNTWKKVATAVTFGEIHILETKPEKYLATHRETGDPPPNDIEEGFKIQGLSVPIKSSNKIDVYIMPRSDDGKIRVDL